MAPFLVVHFDPAVGDAGEGVKEATRASRDRHEWFQAQVQL